MTKREHTDFPLFREFARGYLHQDLVPEHGNAIKAAKAYLGDLGAKDRHEVAREVGRVRANFSELNLSELNQQLRQLGAAWTFKSAAEFEQVLSTLQAAE